MKNLIKNQSVLFLFACSLLILTGWNNAKAQCNSSNQDGSQTSTNTGTALTWSQNANSYEKVSSVISGNSYTVSSSNSSDYITVKTSNAGSGGTVITSGSSPVSFTANSTTIYIIVNTNSSCGTSNTSRNIAWYAAPNFGSLSASSGCVGNTITITGTGFNGATGVTFHNTSASYTVVSSTSITATVPSGATTGTITITGPGGSDVSGSFTINATPGDNSGANQNACSGVSISIGASSTTGHTYKWSPSTGLSSSTASNPTISSPTTTTTYTLTETITSTGCSVANTTVVTVNTSPTNKTVSAVATSLCSGSSTNIQVATSTSGVNYQLRNNADNSTIGSAVAGTGGTINLPTGNLSSNTTFNVLATTAGTSCSLQMTTTPSVTVNVVPSDNSGANQSLCNGASVTLGAASTTGHTYSWSPSTGLSSSTAANPTTSITVTTTYTLTETITSSGCSASNTTVVTVNPIPGDNAGADQAVCSGSSASLGASSTFGHTYKWTPSTGLSSSTAANPTVTPTITTTYTLTETITATGCTASNSAVVTLSSLPNSITISGTASICGGNSVNISVPGSQSGVNYQLRNNSGNTNIGSAVAGIGAVITLPTGSLSSTTTFNVLATNATTGCSTQMANTITISVNAAPGDNAGSDKSICAGTSTTLGASSAAGHTYSWSPSTGLSSATASNPTANPSTTTVYTLTETITSTGCSSANTVTVTSNALPTLSITPNYCNGGGNVQLTATSNASYHWNNGTSNQSITVSLAGTYSVTVTNAAGCTASTNDTVAVELVKNGDFSQGNTGFTTSYNYTSAANGLEPETYYAVGNNANYFHPNFYGVDHTTGSGNFMIVNGATSDTTVTVWQETVTLIPNTNYYFSAYSMSMNQVSPYARLKFEVNGSEIGVTAELPQGANSTAGPFTWTRFYGTWNSGTSTSAVISIVDLQLAAGGNDFGLDDISCSTLSTVPLSTVPTTNSPCLGSSLTLSSNALGGTSPIIYNWTGPNSYASTAANGTLTNASSLMAGTYNLTVTDAHGCTVSATTPSVVINPNPSDNAGADVFTCNGTGVVIGAASTTGHTYNWSPSTNLNSSTTANPTATPALTTTYTLTETITSTGCSAANSAVVNVNALPANNAGTAKTICNGGSAVIGATSTAGHTYSWSPTAGLSSATVSNPTAAPTVTTTYTLTEAITATGCSAANTVVVTVNPIPVNNAGSAKSVCVGSGIAIGATSTAGHTYNWSPSTGLSSTTTANPTATPTITTSYNLTETITATTCAATNSVVVTVNSLPANNAGSNQSVCGGVGVPIGATSTAGHTYSWSPSATLSSSTAANPTATPTVTTTYTLAETITATGCSATNTAVVTTNPGVSNNAGSAKSTCSGTGVTIGAASTAGHTYSWSPSATLSNSTVSNPTASPTATTTYTLTETITATGCSAANSVVVTVNPIPGDNAGADQTICTGSGITIGAASTAGHTYNWSPSTRLSSSIVANPTATPTITTTYTLTETITATTCAATNSVVVTVNASLANNAGSNQSVCKGSGVTLGAASTAGHTYSWSPSATLSSGTISNPTASPTVTTTYTLTETITAGGCSASNSVVVTVTNPPTISVQPANKTTCGSTTTFSITASGSPTYQWYENRATGTFSAVVNANNSFGEYKNATSNTLEIDNPTTAMNSWTYYCVVTTGSCSTTSSTATLTVTAGGMWLGVTSTNWDDATNWCGGVPNQTTDVTIPSGVPHMPNINVNDAQCHTLTINSSATVTISSGGILSLYGDLVVNGTFTQSAGTLDIKGSTTQNIAGVTAYNVIIDNGNNGVTLAGNMIITNNLTFNNGIINTGTYQVDITNASTSSIVNFGKSMYVNGFLKRSVSLNGIYNFPVGSATQCELAIVNFTAQLGISNIVANFNVASMGTVPSGLSSGGKQINQFLNYGYWTLTPDQQPIAGVYTITLNPIGHTNGGGASAYIVVKKPHGSANTNWSAPGTNLLNIVPTILGAVGASMSGLTSFSDFGAGVQSGTILPIKLISFTAEKCDDDADALLKWSTATEENNDHFELEEAGQDNENSGQLTFHTLGEVKGAGNSEVELNYSFVDTEANKSGTRYYRLKQVDFDSTATYSDIVALDFTGAKPITMSPLYPNPVTEMLHFKLTSPDERTITVSVSNLIGQEIFREPMQVNAGENSMNLDVTQLNKGLFFLSLIDGTTKYVPQKFEKF